MFKKNFASINNKFTILDHSSKTTIILITSTLNITKPTYVSLLKNTSPVLLIIITKKYKIIIKFNDNKISFYIKQKFIKKIIDIINMTTQ